MNIIHIYMYYARIFGICM